MHPFLFFLKMQEKNCKKYIFFTNSCEIAHIGL